MLIVPLLLRVETYEFAVSVHVEPEATVTLTVPFCPEVLIAPVKADFPDRLIVRVEALSTRILPARVWPVVFMVTLPPFEPELPQLSELARSKYPDESLLVMVTPERVIVVVVLVTWKISPLVLVILPPVMVKVLAPSDASPDWD